MLRKVQIHIWQFYNKSGNCATKSCLPNMFLCVCQSLFGLVHTVEYQERHPQLNVGVNTLNYPVMVDSERLWKRDMYFEECSCSHKLTSILFLSIRDVRQLIICDIPVIILLMIRISLPVIRTIKSSCYSISVCHRAEQNGVRWTWNRGGLWVNNELPLQSGTDLVRAVTCNKKNQSVR